MYTERAEDQWKGVSTGGARERAQPGEVIESNAEAYFSA